MSNDSWLQYAEYARNLDGVRAQEAARTEGMREGVAQMSSKAEELEARLRGQSGMLLNLATELRLRRPKLEPIPPADEILAPPGLGLVEAATDRADREARQAATRGQKSALLPNLSVKARGLLVYGLAALVVLALQALSFSRDGAETSPITVLFVIPLIGFVLGFLVLQLGSRARMVQNRPGPPTRLGFVLCFLVGPVGAVIVVIAGMQSN